MPDRVLAEIEADIAEAERLISELRLEIAAAYQSRNEAVMDALVKKLMTPQLPTSPAFNALTGTPPSNLAPLLIPGTAAANRNVLLDGAARMSMAPPPMERHSRGGPPR